MKTNELFQTKTVFSFEVFPPKRDYSVSTIYYTIEELSVLKPDYISVTYGAGGSDNSKKTIEIASAIKNQYKIESVAHLTGLYHTKSETIKIIEQLKDCGVENILALRGDESPDYPPSGDFQYANELIAFICEHSDHNLIAACYPEGHSQSRDIITDIQNLKQKVDAGVTQLISQVFFDNQYFYQFLERARIGGIHVPIQAGIMPVVNKRQIERMVSLCGATLPDKFLKMMARYEHQPEAMRDAGIAYAVDQIVDLVAQGVDGIHLYTMNNPLIAKKICQATSSLINA